jgi:hypothetical protein
MLDDPTRIRRFADAYQEMAKRTNYRPAAPSDGLGNITLSKEQIADPVRLRNESVTYATEFADEDDAMEFWVGCSNFETNRALVYAIEAARAMRG